MESDMEDRHIRGERRDSWGKEARQEAIIRRNWHQHSRWDADLIYLSRLSGILILVRGRASSSTIFYALSNPLVNFFPPSPSSFSHPRSGPPEAHRELLANWLYLRVSRSCSPSVLFYILDPFSASYSAEGSQRGRHKSDTRTSGVSVS